MNPVRRRFVPTFRIRLSSIRKMDIPILSIPILSTGSMQRCSVNRLADIWQPFPMHKNRHLLNSLHKLALNAQISGLAVTTTEIGTSGNGSMERHSPIQTGIPGTMAESNSASRTISPEMNGIFVSESPIKPMKLGSNMLDAGMILQTELAMRTMMFC